MELEPIAPPDAKEIQAVETKRRRTAVAQRRRQKSSILKERWSEFRSGMD